MTASCVTGATGFVGGHVAQALVKRGDSVRVTYRDRERLGRLGALEAEEVRADVLDRGSMRRALRGSDVVFHTAGYVGSRPRELVWDMNALSPRVVVEAAAAEDVGRVVLTSSVAAIGRAPHGEAATEETVFRGGEFGLAYAEAKHEGEAEALAAGARLGVEVVVVNPSYVLGVPVDRTQPGETSTRVVGNFLLGRLPAVVDGATNVVDVEDVAVGHRSPSSAESPGSDTSSARTTSPGWSSSIAWRWSRASIGRSRCCRARSGCSLRGRTACACPRRSLPRLSR